MDCENTQKGKRLYLKKKTVPELIGEFPDLKEWSDLLIAHERIQILEIENQNLKKELEKLGNIEGF